MERLARDLPIAVDLEQREQVRESVAGPVIDGKALRRPHDLRDCVLLHDDSLAFDKAAPAWSTWLKNASAEGVNARRGPRFSHPDHAMQAAMDGAGVVLGWRRLAAADLAAGRLAIPFDIPLPMRLGFFLVSSSLSASRPKVVAFREWLLAEVDADRRLGG